MKYKNKSYELYLNGHETIHKYLDNYIEGLVLFYGEEKRELITNKIRNAFIIGYSIPKELNYIATKSNEREKCIAKIRYYENTVSECNFSSLAFNLWDMIENDRQRRTNSKIININNYFKYKENDEVLKKEILMNVLEQFINSGYGNITYEELLTLIDENWFNANEIIVNYNGNKYEFNNPYYQSKVLLIFFLDGYGIKVSVKELEELEKNGELEVLEELLKGIPRLEEELKKIDKKYQPYRDYYNDEIELRKRMEDIGDKVIFTLIKPYLSKEEQKEIEELLNDPNKKATDFSGYSNYCGYTIGELKGDIVSFTTESCNILDNPESTEKVKEKILKSRVNFLRRKGIFVNIEDAYDLSMYEPIYAPTKEIADKIEKIIYTTINDTNEYIFEKNPYNMIINEELSKLDIYNKTDIPYTSELYLENYAGVVTPTFQNSKEQNGEKVFKPVSVVYVKEDDDLDHTIIHELNHIVEAEGKITENDGVEEATVRSGWKQYTFIPKPEREEPIESIRKDPISFTDYELFNEIVNEKIAQKVFRLMMLNHLLVFDYDEALLYSSYYEHAAFLVEEFMNYFLPEIIEARITGNMDILFDVIGKENFESLNDLFNEFEELLPKIRHIYRAIKNNRITPEVIRYNEIIKAKDEIIENMVKHSKKDVKTLKKTLNH